MTNIQTALFLRLSDGQSLSNIANQFHMSRSAVSRHLRQLEEELELQLFVTTGAGARLTLEGTVIIPAVRRFSDSMRKTLEASGHREKLPEDEMSPVLSTDDLHIVLTVKRILNYSDCSEILHLSEAAISKRILKIEDALGMRLFDRVRGSSIKTSQDAVPVFSFAEKALNAYDELTREAENIAIKRGRKITVGVPPHISNASENKFLTDFCMQNPDIELITVEAFLSELIDKFNNGSIDVILAKRVESEGRESNFEDLDDNMIIDMGECTLHVVLPANHPLSREKELDLTQLKDTPFIIVGNKNNSKSILPKFFDACRKSGFEPNVTSYPRITRGVLLSHVRNYHYATLSLTGPESARGDVCFVPLHQPFIKASVVLIVKRGKSFTRAVSRMLSFAMDYADESVV